MKTGLIMEDGAMRGMFTCGILDVFMENGVTFDGAGGISAGAVFGCNFKSKQIGRAIRYNKRFCRDPRYCGVRSLIRTGDLYGADFCYRTIPDELDIFDRDAFNSNPMEFYCGAVDIVNGDIVYHKCADGDERDFLWLRASGSMPFVSRPVEVDGYTLLDGGIMDATPYRYMTSVGYDRNVVILTRPLGYRKGKSGSTLLSRILLRKYPKVKKILNERHLRYNAEIDLINRDEASGKIIVLRPPEPLGISRTEKDPTELERVYNVGRREAEKHLASIKTFLEG